MAKQARNKVLTTIAVDLSTDKLIDKLCKRYSLKKGEITKLVFEYIDKASINPNEAPESIKAELKKINKRQDDIIRFIRHYEEEQLNPMIRTTNSIAMKFDNITKSMEDIIITQLENHQESHSSLLKLLSEKLAEHANVINYQGKQIASVAQLQQTGNQKLLKLIALYTELTTLGVMDGKRKDTLKTEIIKLIDYQ